jgi:hypothetical protein
MSPDDFMRHLDKNRKGYDITEYQTNMLQDKIKNGKLFDKVTTLTMMKPFIEDTVDKKSDVDISSSHVVRIKHNTNKVKQIITDINKII